MAARATSVDDERAHDEGELEEIEGAGRRERISRGDGVQQEAEDDGEQQIEADQNLPLDVDPAARPDHRRQEHHENQGEERA